MPPLRIRSSVAAILLGTMLSPLVSTSEIILGDPPQAPTDLAGLPGGEPRAAGGASGFNVNTDSREEVRSFFNTVYRASDEVPMNSTANVATCTPGMNGDAFREAVQRRINWFRAMAGVPADITFDGGNNVKDQEAAMMMSRNNMLSHTPTNTWICWTASGSNAANRSNLSLGSAGPDAVSGYMRDHGTNNAFVGHRRWLLYPQTEIMGTGDVPAAGSLKAANAVWVFDANYGGPRPTTRTPYAAWPPEGYAPYQTVYPRWSFSLPNADFSSATVTMRSNNVVVPVLLAPNQNGVGETSVVWVPMGLDANDQDTVFPFNGMDTVYTVTVTNVFIGVNRTGYTYTVTVFDPAIPGQDYAPPVIAGPGQPGVGLNNAYTFTGLPYASGYEWRATRASNYSLNDGAEAGLGNFTTNTSPGYAVRDSAYEASGSFCFRLAHPDAFPNAPPDEMLTLNQVFVPKTNGTLTFKSRIGYAAEGETARVQVSTDGGSSWQDVFTQSGIGDGTSAPVESGYVTRSLPLGAFAGLNIKLRFNYTYTSGLYYIYVQPGVPIGWYLDDVTIANAEVWTLVASNTTATTNFTFNPPQATNYNLNVRAVMYDEFPLDWGTTKSVFATTNVPAVIVMNRPVLANGQIQLPFNLASGFSATFKLLQSDQVNGPWATNASATLTTNVPGSSYQFTTTPGSAMRFYRVKVP